MKDLKHSNPAELSKYVVANGLVEDLAFKWWFKDLLKKRDCIVEKQKSKYWWTMHNLGIKIPNSLQESYVNDKETKTSYWRDDIRK